MKTSSKGYGLIKNRDNLYFSDMTPKILFLRHWKALRCPVYKNTGRLMLGNYSLRTYFAFTLHLEAASVESFAVLLEVFDPNCFVRNVGQKLYLALFFEGVSC